MANHLFADRAIQMASSGKEVNVKKILVPLVTLAALWMAAGAPWRAWG
jgi:hypothetical protein